MYENGRNVFVEIYEKEMQEVYSLFISRLKMREKHPYTETAEGSISVSPAFEWVFWGILYQMDLSPQHIEGYHSLTFSQKSTPKLLMANFEWSLNRNLCAIPKKNCICVYVCKILEI